MERRTDEHERFVCWPIGLQSVFGKKVSGESCGKGNGTRVGLSINWRLHTESSDEDRIHCRQNIIGTSSSRPVLYLVKQD